MRQPIASAFQLAGTAQRAHLDQAGQITPVKEFSRFTTKSGRKRKVGQSGYCQFQRLSDRATIYRSLFLLKLSDKTSCRRRDSNFG